MVKYFELQQRTEGFGAHYLAAMSIFAYCEKHKEYEFVFRGFKTIGHNLNANALTKFCGIPVNNKKLQIDKSDTHSSEGMAREYYTPQVVDTLRKYYYTNPKPNVNTDIAIHIRRGDITCPELYNERWVEMDYYIKIIEKLKSIYPNRIISIFSQGNLEMFKELWGANIKFELDKDIEYTYHSMVKAKVLLIAHSTLSFSAAILNTNKIYFLKVTAPVAFEYWECIDK